MVEPYYDDGTCVIYHGDCREIDAWDVAGAFMVTDPPYGINHASNRPGAPRRGLAIANDDTTATRDDVLARWSPRPAIVFGTCRQPAPGGVKATLVWDKGGHVGMGDLSMPWKQNWEHVYVLGGGFSGRRDTGVLKFNAVEPWGNRLVHPHEKPVELLRALVGKCAPLAEIVDPFMGSGTTLRAAKDLGRKAVGIEIEERYCEIAARRLAQEVLDLGYPKGDGR